MRSRRILYVACGAAGLCALATFTGFAAGASQAAAPHQAASPKAASPKSPHFTVEPMIRVPGASNSGMTLTSGNWAGYVALPRKVSGSFRHVQATFTVPSVNCAKTPKGIAVQWVGLDGFNSNTVEQDGVQASCGSGGPVYAAWWENFPKNPIEVVSSVKVRPGDAITASVFFNAAAGAHHNQYNLVLTDVTNGKSFNLWKPCGASSCPNNSAEVISEAPSNSEGILPLADYGIASFLSVGVTNKAGQRGGIAGKNWTNDRIIQTGKGGHTLATPSPLFGGKGFSNTWKRPT
ncbi:MAG TPA: G1 family glutamic endopeptidase [Streptosporangiaceae bacterium]|jgi:hypothetical protein